MEKYSVSFLTIMPITIHPSSSLSLHECNQFICVVPLISQASRSCVIWRGCSSWAAKCGRPCLSACRGEAWEQGAGVWGRAHRPCLSSHGQSLWSLRSHHHWWGSVGIISCDLVTLLQQCRWSSYQCLLIFSVTWTLSYYPHKNFLSTVWVRTLRTHQ